MARKTARKSRFSLDAVDRLRAGGGAAAVEVQRPGASCKAGSWRQIRSSVAENAPLLAVVGAYILTCLALRTVTGHPDLAPINDSTVAVGWRYLFVAAALPLGYHLIHFLLARLHRTGDRRRASLIEEWTEYRKRHFSVHRVVGLLIACVSLAVLLSTFWAFKKVLPVFSPFVWDPSMMRLDRALHFGTDPWALLQPILGHPAVTFLLDRLYYVWFIFIPLMIAWQGWSRNRKLRLQFLLTYALCWILLGTVLAYWLSSAGPCYYGLVEAGPDPFAPLMDYLYGVHAQVPLNALQVQEWLWSGYAGLGPFEGISAMPSLHVALPVLYALVGVRVNRWLGLGFGIYAFLIFLGSVHLGWHYAIDGYVSVLAVIAIWKLVGYFLDREACTAES